MVVGSVVALAEEEASAEALKAGLDGAVASVAALDGGHIIPDGEVGIGAPLIMARGIAWTHPRRLIC